MADDFSISKTEEALIVAMKSFIEFLIASQPATRQRQMIEIIEATFRAQRDAMLQEGNQEGVGLFEHLRKFAADPRRQAKREELARLLQEPPQGQA